MDKHKSTGKRTVQRLLLAVGSAVLLLALGELAVRVLPLDLSAPETFFYPSGNSVYIGTRQVTIPFEPLLPYYWLPPANTELTNHRRLAGKREHADTKPSNTLRIAMMGCSCTQGGQEAYPARAERLLEEALGTNRYEFINGGVGSYSTHQGLELFKKHILPLKPDIVTVLYGWNDRWVHDRRRDSRHRFPSEQNLRITDSLRKHSRLFQFLFALKARWMYDEIEQRVPPDEYAKNLRTFIKLCRDNHIKVLLCTTPDGSSPRLIKRRFDPNAQPPDQWSLDLYSIYAQPGQSPEDVWHGIHRRYNDVVRLVAQDEDVELLDLEKKFNARQAAYSEPGLGFYLDGIHYTPRGEQALARLFVDALAASSDRDTVSAYLQSVDYYYTNAVRFADQFAFATAQHFLDQAVSLGLSSNKAAPLQAVIDQQRPFYDAYAKARYAKSNGAPPEEVAQAYIACLSLRPEDAELRLNTAQDLRDMGFHDLCIQIIETTPGTYAREQRHRALWLIMESCFAMGYQQKAAEVLTLLHQQYPDDQRATALWQRMTGSTR